MAEETDKTVSMQFKYVVEMTYLNIYNNTSTDIKNECVRSIAIDHNYDDHCMPTVIVNMRLDKALIDDMILHANDNLIILAIYKYDDLTDDKPEQLCFRKKFTYFIPNEVNVNDPIDYTDGNIEQSDEDTYGELIMGLIAVDHINYNKRHCQLSVKNATNYDCVKYLTDKIDNIIIEPFTYSTEFEQLIMPPQDSVNKALQWLNDNRVFYNTPYRFYMDFNYAYIMSSAGRAVENRDETYSSILINILDITDEAANDVGIIDNKTSETYEMPINYANVQVYDNTIVNKSRSAIRGISSTGVQDATLKTSASYLDEKIKTVRLNNDNDNMMYNIEHYENSQQILLYCSKVGIDSDLFTINKRITVRFIERYSDYDGVYLLYRKRDLYMREDKDFELLTTLNLHKLESEESI